MLKKIIIILSFILQLFLVDSATQLGTASMQSQKEVWQTDWAITNVFRFMKTPDDFSDAKLKEALLYASNEDQASLFTGEMVNGELRIYIYLTDERYVEQLGIKEKDLDKINHTKGKIENTKGWSLYAFDDYQIAYPFVLYASTDYYDKCIFLEELADEYGLEDHIDFEYFFIEPNDDLLYFDFEDELSAGAYSTTILKDTWKEIISFFALILPVFLLLIFSYANHRFKQYGIHRMMGYSIFDVMKKEAWNQLKWFIPIMLISSALILFIKPEARTFVVVRYILLLHVILFVFMCLVKLLPYLVMERKPLNRLLKKGYSTKISFYVSFVVKILFLSNLLYFSISSFEIIGRDYPSLQNYQVLLKRNQNTIILNENLSNQYGATMENVYSALSDRKGLYYEFPYSSLNFAQEELHDVPTFFTNVNYINSLGLKDALGKTIVLSKDKYYLLIPKRYYDSYMKHPCLDLTPFEDESSEIIKLQDHQLYPILRMEGNAKNGYQKDVILSTHISRYASNAVFLKLNKGETIEDIEKVLTDHQIDPDLYTIYDAEAFYQREFDSLKELLVSTVKRFIIYGIFIILTVIEFTSVYINQKKQRLAIEFMNGYGTLHSFIGLLLLMGISDVIGILFAYLRCMQNGVQFSIFGTIPVIFYLVVEMCFLLGWIYYFRFKNIQSLLKGEE